MNFLQWRPSRRLALGALLALAAVATARAQDYPRQPIKLIVPFVAGGGADVFARIIAPKLGDELGQPVIIENRGGAGGMLGATAAAQAAADGYTLFLGTGSTHGTSSSVYPKLTYDPVRDFAPVALMAKSPMLLVVSSKLEVNSLEELIALARAKPGELSFASYGTGSLNHLAGEMLNSMADIRANHIPYRGAAPAMTDLIAGRVHYTIDGVTTSMQYVDSGMIRLLGVASLERSPVLPDRPTVAEAGVPGFDATAWYGLFAPAGTPKPIVELLNRKMNATLADPTVIAGIQNLRLERGGGTPEVLANRVQTELKKWADLVREKNIRVDQ